MVVRIGLNINMCLRCCIQENKAFYDLVQKQHCPGVILNCILVRIYADHMGGYKSLIKTWAVSTVLSQILHMDGLVFNPRRISLIVRFFPHFSQLVHWNCLIFGIKKSISLIPTHWKF